MKREVAVFLDRTECINCGSLSFEILSGGSYKDDPINKYIGNDPWGISPLPYIEDERWEFVHCNDCQQMFHKRILSTRWIEKCYSEWVSHEAIQKFKSIHLKLSGKLTAGKNNVLHFLRIENMTRQIRGAETPRILDYGCGYGDFLSICDSFGAASCGVDFSPGRRSHGRIEIFPDLQHLSQAPQAQEKFHAITLFEVLEHLDTPLIALQTLRQYLLPGGILILTTPDCSKVTSIETPSDYRLINPLSHINGFTGETLRSMAINAGFTPVTPVTAYVTSDRIKVIKTEIKRLIDGFLPLTTQQYFTLER